MVTARKIPPPPPPVIDPLLSLAAAGRFLDFHVDTIRKMVRQGQIRAYRIGNSGMRFRRSELEALLVPVPAADHLGR